MGANNTSWRKRLQNRFPFLRWPLDFFTVTWQEKKETLPLAAKTKKTKYPIRMLRYLWVISSIAEEIKRMKSPPVIADIGCDRALLKRMLPSVDGARVIGLDLEEKLIKNRQLLAMAHYDELKPCDLDVSIPLPDASVDIVVNLHVMEHLPRPEYAIAELSRVLRPGGLLLLGFPVMPKFVASHRQKVFARQFNDGSRVMGQHQHAFWMERARSLIQGTDLDVEFMIGTYFVRSQGAFWENSAIWLRINQIWGALFPALSQELCMKLRKPS